MPVPQSIITSSLQAEFSTESPYYKKAVLTHNVSQQPSQGEAGEAVAESGQGWGWQD